MRDSRKLVCVACRAAVVMLWIVAGTAPLGVAVGADEPSKPAPSAADKPAAKPTGKAVPDFRPETEIDVSGPYHALLNGESYPAALDVWGPDAMLKISIDGQEKPMTGAMLNNQLKVGYKYGAANFNLTTMVQALYDGRNFNGQYDRIDEKLGAKQSPITLTPDWYHGGGGTPVKMPVPHRPGDIPGHYGLALTKDGRSINTTADLKVDNGVVTMSAGGRLYTGEYSPNEIAPVFWENKRMDVFHLAPTETGFKGTLLKEINGKQEEFEAVMVKGKGGGGGHEHDWTYVYDVIFSNSPPVWIGKLTVHEDQANLVILIKNEKAHLTGSLVDGILSGTGPYGRETVSIRAQKNAHGFAGVFRNGVGAAVREFPVVLKNRPARAAGGQTW